MRLSHCYCDTPTDYCLGLYLATRQLPDAPIDWSNRHKSTHKWHVRGVKAHCSRQWADYYKQKNKLNFPNETKIHDSLPPPHYPNACWDYRHPDYWKADSDRFYSNHAAIEHNHALPHPHAAQHLHKANPTPPAAYCYAQCVLHLLKIVLWHRLTYPPKRFDLATLSYPRHSQASPVVAPLPDVQH